VVIAVCRMPWKIIPDRWFIYFHSVRQTGGVVGGHRRPIAITRGVGAWLPCCAGRFRNWASAGDLFIPGSVPAPYPPATIGCNFGYFGRRIGLGVIDHSATGPTVGILFTGGLFIFTSV